MEGREEAEDSKNGSWQVGQLEQDDAGLVTVRTCLARRSLNKDFAVCSF